MEADAEFRVGPADEGSSAELFAGARPSREARVGPGQVEIHAADMAVTAAGDVTLDELSSRLAEAGHWLPLEGESNLTLAEAVLHDVHGPLRLGYGGWRDLLLGVQLRDGRGRLVTAGGMTMKNVAGYDLVKFTAGSHGCFGTPETVTLRTYRRPEGSLAAWLGVAGAEVAERVGELLTSPAPPQWVLWTPDGLRAGWLGMEVELQKLAPVISEVMGTPPQARSLEEDGLERLEALRVGEPWARVTLPPRQIVRFTEGLPEICRERWAADPALGTVWVKEMGRGGRLAALAGELGGHVALLGREGNQWRVGVSGVNEGSAAVLGRLKAAFDPGGRLPVLPME